MWKRNLRGRIEVTADILAICTDSWTRRTHIMYKANLSYTMLSLYMPRLVRVDLINEDGSLGHREYRTTEKGRQFLGYYKRVLDILGEDGGEVLSTAAINSALEKALDMIGEPNKKLIVDKLVSNSMPHISAKTEPDHSTHSAITKIKENLIEILGRSEASLIIRRFELELQEK